MSVVPQLVHVHHDKQVRLALVEPVGSQLRTGVSQPTIMFSGCYIVVRKIETNEEKFMIPCVQFFLSADTTTVTLTTVVVSLCTNVTCGLTLHWIVGAIGVQKDADFCPTPRVRVID